MPVPHKNGRMPLDPPPDPSDEFLITSMLGGDEAALNKLIQRFDRLVRYTILGAARDRCLHDPQWLDSMASATWAGFVRSVQRYPDRRPRSLPAYLAAIAKYQVLGAIRGAPTPGETPLSVEHLDSDIAATTEEPSEILSELELLETVRACLSELETTIGPWPANSRRLRNDAGVMRPRPWESVNPHSGRGGNGPSTGFGLAWRGKPGFGSRLTASTTTT